MDRLRQLRITVGCFSKMWRDSLAESEITVGHKTFSDHF